MHLWMKETRIESANADGQHVAQHEALRVLGIVSPMIQSPRMRTIAVTAAYRSSAARFTGLKFVVPNPAFRYAFGFVSCWATRFPSTSWTRLWASLIALTNSTSTIKLLCLILLLSLCGCGPDTNNNESTKQPTNSAKSAKISAPVPANLNRIIKSEHFRAHFSSKTTQKEIEDLLKTLEDAHANYSRHLSQFGINLNAISSTEILIHDSTGDFISSTGHNWWTGAVTKDNRIEIQPLEALRKRRILETTLRHELAHIFIHAASRKPIPRWLDEGTAVYLSGEGAEFLKVEIKTKLTTDEIEKRLASPSSYEEMRALYAAAYREVQIIILSNGNENDLWDRIASY
jgi:hypothetical protein